METMNATAETIINDGLENWESCAGDSVTKDFIYGMIYMYMHLNWDRDDSSFIISFINAIDIIEWRVINDYIPCSIEESRTHAHNVQLLGNIRRELEEFMDDCLQELDNF